MKWFWQDMEKVREEAKAALSPAPMKPKYYSVTVKKAPEWIPNFGYGHVPGAGAGFYAIKAHIIDRDSGKMVGIATGYFDSMDNSDEGLNKLQADIHVKIKALYAMDALIQRLYQVDITNNGLELFLP